MARVRHKTKTKGPLPLRFQPRAPRAKRRGYNPKRSVNPARFWRDPKHIAQS